MSAVREVIPFGRSSIVGNEIEYMKQAIARGHLSGDGEFTRRCHQWFVEHLGVRHALLTHSCTAALELAAIVSGVGPGDEVIMPSYTFVSTANAFVLRGAVPVFVDVRPDTINLDESLVEAAITPKTKVIAPIHYAGVPCDMDRLGEIARRHGLLVIEDAAQALGSTYGGKPLGTLGELGCLSFHDTKNVVCGEGGALLFRDADFVDRAEIVREKGTNRKAFFRGLVDKYSWVDIGSSYLPGELTAAFLYAQLEGADAITQRRLALCRAYRERLRDLERDGHFTLPGSNPGGVDSGHIFYLLTASLEEREALRRFLLEDQIHAVSHYVPLHSAVAGLRYGRAHGTLPVTDRAGDSLLRLPMFNTLTDSQVDRVCDRVRAFYRR